MTKKFLRIFGVILIILAASEIFLQKYFGFCDAVLLQEDPDYEYIAAPNQHRFRFRYHIDYNNESMRSSEIDDTAVKILGFGDSIINGGSITDQDSLATTILSDTLSKIYHKKIQFLNISAGSWGPDNCYAYLKRHGDFGAKGIFLFVNSHDSYDNMNFRKIVGINDNFPDKQYKSALMELTERYIIPKVRKMLFNAPYPSEELGINKKFKGSVFNTGFKLFADYAKSKQIPLTIYLHAERSELRAGKYNQYGQEIIRFAEANHIRIIKDLENGLLPTDFRDKIHINSQGQRRLAMTILKYGL